MSYTTKEKFNKSMSQGDLGERVIAMVLNNKKGLNKIQFNRPSVFINVKQLRKWDLRGYIDGEIHSFEIKTDCYEFYNGDTGNMFIEIKCNGKASGIEVSTADYLVYYYPYNEEVYVMYIKTLKKWLENWKTHLTYGGDSGVALGYLMKRDDIKQSGLFQVWTDIPKEIFIGLNKLV